MASSRLRSLACCALAALAACGGGAKDEQLYGRRWQRSRDTLQLFPDGRMVVRQSGYSFRGTFKHVGRNRLVFQHQAPVSPLPDEEYEITLTADSLTFCERTSSTGLCLPYARVIEDSAGRADSAARALSAQQRTPATEAEAVLKETFIRQQFYRMDHGHYAPELDSLRSAVWEPPPLRHFKPLRMTAGGDSVCITLEPRSFLRRSWHIDQTGKVVHGGDCH